MRILHRRSHLLALTVFSILLAILVTACSSTQETPETSTEEETQTATEEATEEPEVMAEEEEAIEEPEVAEEATEEPEVMAEETKEVGETIDSNADPFVAEAIDKVIAATAPSTKWDGPTSGPAIEPGKLIVYVASDLRNGGVLGVSKGVEEAAAAVGWEVQIIDGQGSVSGRTAAFNQAITLQPDGIILGGFDAVEQAVGIEEAAAAGIPVVGWHAAADPGPIEGTPVFANVATDANNVAEIAALYAVAQSNGEAGVVIFTDSAFSVAIAKSDAMAAAIEKCAGCTLLSVEDTPLADTSTRMPQLVASLLQRYGDDWTYSLGINDLYFDFGGPTLATAGRLPSGPPFNLSAGDGSEAAYQRIRDNEFQTGTVPEPLNLHGWQLIDELNRAMVGEEWSGYITPVHLVVGENIEFDGGPNNTYDPDNGYRDVYLSIWGGGEAMDSGDGEAMDSEDGEAMDSGDGEAMADDDFVANAKARVEAATVPTTEWDGPTSGPAAQEDKLIVYVASDLRNGGVLGVSKGVEEAVAAIGWEVQVIDGQGSVSGRTTAFNQAITLQPDGIILGGFDAVEQAAGIEEATAAGIPVVGWHAAADPGPVEGTPVFANVTTDANDVAGIAALYAVAQSNGEAGVVIFTDSAFSVAIAKSDAMAAVIEACPGCTLLSVEDTPLADTSTRMPQLATSLLQRYGDDWTYSLGINDLYFDFSGPALATAGKSPEGPPFNLSAGDGSEAAYQRIRDNDFQVGTVPEPLNLHGWQLVDELNRALAGEEWSGYVTPVHLVTPDNIEFDGGPDNVYDPDNGYRAIYLSIWGK